MGRPKKNAEPKDEFAELDSEFKDKVAGSDEAAIRDTIATVALNEVQNQNNKADDQDLAQKREEAAVAGAQYKDASKMNKLRIRFARRVLSDKGKKV